MVEHNLAKVGVASSNLVSRSNNFRSIAHCAKEDSKEGHDLAEWQSGYAAACKAVDVGSIPASASNDCPGGGIGRRKGLKIPR